MPCVTAQVTHPWSYPWSRVTQKWALILSLPFNNCVTLGKFLVVFDSRLFAYKMIVRVFASLLECQIRLEDNEWKEQNTLHCEVDIQKMNNYNNDINNNNTSSKKRVRNRQLCWKISLQCKQTGELLPLLSCTHPISDGRQLPTPTCRPQKRPSGTGIWHHSRHRKDQKAVISLTRACVSIYYSLSPPESQSLMMFRNFLRALCLTSTPGSVELASCCWCLPSGLPVHPLVDLQRARPHSVCALWPSCLYTFSDPMPWRLYLPWGCLQSLFAALCINWTPSSFGCFPRIVTLSCLGPVHQCPIPHWQNTVPLSTQPGPALSELS